MRTRSNSRQRTSVKIVAGDHVASLVEKLQERGLRRHARGESEARHAALQLRDGLLEGRARRVAGPGIFPARMHARRGLREGGRGINRRHHRAGAGIRLDAGMDRQRGRPGLLRAF